MKLYSYFRSSSSWRVRMALQFKGIAHELAIVNIIAGEGEQKTDAYREKNPMQQVPLLEVEEEGRTLRISQSLAILEYLEERHPTPPLLPADAAGRARVRQIAEVVNAGIQPMQNLSLQRYVKRVHGLDEAAFTRHFLEEGFAALETMVREGAGKFAHGDAPTIADCCIVPQMLGGRRHQLDMSRFPTLLRIEAACAEVPVFQRAAPEQQPDFR